MDSIYKKGYKKDSDHIFKKYNRSKSLLSQGFIIRETTRYACTVVALTEVAYQENLLYSKSIKKTFNKIWKYTKTKKYEEDKDNNTKYGETSPYQIASGMKKYIKKLSKKNN